MKLAIQIVSWITIVICGLLVLSAVGESDSELLVGSVLFGVLPVLNVVYFSKNK